MKKFLSLILSTMMALSIVATTASADGQFEVSANDVTVEKGASTVTVSISLKNNPGITGYNSYVGYNASVLEFLGGSGEYSIGDTFSKKYSISFNKPNTKNNPFICNPFSTDPIEGDGEFIKLVFHVKDGATPGTYPITVSASKRGNFSDSNGNKIDSSLIKYTNGSVTIPGAVEEEVKADFDKDAATKYEYDTVYNYGVGGTVTVPAGKSTTGVTFDISNGTDTFNYDFDFGTSIAANTSFGLNIGNVPKDVTLTFSNLKVK